MASGITLRQGMTARTAAKVMAPAVRAVVVRPSTNACRAAGNGGSTAVGVVAEATVPRRSVTTVLRTEPWTATPREAPTWRVASFTADPSPAWDGGIAPMTVSVPTAATSPAPSPAMTSKSSRCP